MSAELSELLDAIKAKGVSVTLNPERTKRPFKCPVCNGAGGVPGATYQASPGGEGNSTSTTPPPRVSCRSCVGTGVLWG